MGMQAFGMQIGSGLSGSLLLDSPPYDWSWWTLPCKIIKKRRNATNFLFVNFLFCYDYV